MRRALYHPSGYLDLNPEAMAACYCSLVGDWKAATDVPQNTTGGKTGFRIQFSKG